MGERQVFPHWPRGLSEEQAASYVGVSVTTFRDEIKKGMWPKGERRGPKGGRVVWDKAAIDLAWNERSNLNGANDPLLERARGWSA